MSLFRCSSRSTGVTAVAVAGALGVILLSGTAATPRRAADGLTFSYRMTSARAASDPKDRDAAARQMHTLVRMSEGVVRVDFRENAHPLAGSNGYMLVRGEPARLEFVNPENREVAILGAEALGTVLGAFTNNALIKVTQSNEKFDYEDLGAGETILGYKTRHVRIRSAQTTETRVLLKRDRTTNESTIDAFIARDVLVDDASMRAWTRSFASGLRTTNPELLRRIDEYQRGPGKGIMLKSTTYSKDIDARGKATYDTLRVEIAQLERGAIDASVFTYPKDYKVTDMTTEIQAAAQTADSASKAAADSSKAADKPSAQDALKKGLRGLIKKP